VTGVSKKPLSAFWDSSRAYYEQAAATNPEASPDRQVLFSHLKPGDRVLDLGSGSCENSLWVPAGCRYVGLDVSTTALVMAREAKRPATGVRGDGETLPFAESAFDAVLSTWALEHFHDPGRTFLEAARVLKPGGLLLLVGSTWDLPYEMPPSLPPGRRLEVALRRLGRQLGDLATGRHGFDLVREPRVLTEGYVPDADAVHVAQSWQVGRFLTAIGFALVEHASLPHRPDPAGPRGLLRRLLRALPPWRRGWGNTLIVARRGARVTSAPFRQRWL
jgi:SAM-dependent methyltransferase